MKPESATIKESFHFAGSGEFKPISVEATSYDEAVKKWEDVREPVAPVVPLPLEDKNVVE
jgi:hypothetical protein